ncbi:MAG: ATP-binding cassette domain-containing protein [Candidatus Methanofishera endochildressiae]|uniref:ATP-binding cassette domain-containing protein n=1 Tax=Candidatus Methanofishera endochildressiae TaxID=2738884 RepID=A0A7Z0MNJ9_9GAMM|nr:ATP-binding cassette domain-containing protein [Candidatus Methanofishera endochildressiae]
MVKELALEISNLNFSYGKKKVLHKRFFSENGNAYVFLRPRKSTLFSLVTRLYAHKHGKIQLAGFNIQKKPLKALAQLGVVFQQTTLDLDLSVQQNLRYHAALQGIDKKTNQGKGQLSVWVKTAEKVGAPAYGGHRRRVKPPRLHARAYFDEPRFLDAPSRQAIVEHVHQLVQRGPRGSATPF